MKSEKELEIELEKLKIERMKLESKNKIKDEIDQEKTRINKAKYGKILDISNKLVGKIQGGLGNMRDNLEEPDKKKKKKDKEPSFGFDLGF